MIIGDWYLITENIVTSGSLDIIRKRLDEHHEHSSTNWYKIYYIFFEFSDVSQSIHKDSFW